MLDADQRGIATGESRGARTITIGRRRIGPGEPVYIIAELSANHGGDFESAAELVRAAARAGADAVKLQTYTADGMTLRSDRPPFRVGDASLWRGQLLHDLYASAAMPWEWQPELKRLAEASGIQCFSTPCHVDAVPFLVDELDVPCFKIASFELVDHALIEAVARTGRPMIMSTGMATLEEVDEAVTAARKAGATQLALLRCNSAYPAPASEFDLRTMAHMAATWGVPVGVSDHTLGTTIAVAAVALGATLVEKHLTLDRRRPTPDAAFSAEPDEFAAMVRAVRETEAALGGLRYGPSESEKASLAFRRSLFVVASVAAGELFTPENLRSIRPALGLAPKHLAAVIGRRAACSIEAGTPLSWDMVGQ
ncbi:MAG: pseudaminic acid synthase [Candidatus Dormiibacterota bacterium]